MRAARVRAVVGGANGITAGLAERAGAAMIVAKLIRRNDPALWCHAALEAGRVAITETNDKPTLVRLHTLFKTGRRAQRSVTRDEVEVLDLAPATPLHFLACLDQLSDEWLVELEKNDGSPDSSVTRK